LLTIAGIDGIALSFLCDVDDPNATWIITCIPRTSDDDSSALRFTAGVISLVLAFISYRIAEENFRRLQIPAAESIV